MPQSLDARAQAVRAFNRFYTRQIGLLEEHLLQSGYSLTQARVLYELAHRDGLTAVDLRRDLGLDAGYVSRILAGFRKRGLIDTTPSPTDRRQSVLCLTDEGRRVYAPMRAASQGQIEGMLAPLCESDRDRVVRSLATVQRLLGGEDPAAVPYVLRPHRIGDVGIVVARQAELYAREFGWNHEFEALAAEIGAAFIRDFDPARDCCWIAERDEEIVGSAFVVRQSDEIAKLRMVYVDASARGLGIGRRLVDECLRFARRAGYSRMTLWTNDVLTSARRMYESAGFELVAEEAHRSFGKDLVGQHWDRAL